MRLEDLIGRYGLDDRTFARLTGLAQRLQDDERAPTALREPSQVLTHHIADSVVGLELDQVRGAQAVADIGSGAGLPGAALAASLPDAAVTLVEARRDRCSFLVSMLGSIELANARVVCARAEQWQAGLLASDLVVARAVALQPVVLEYAAPLLALGGTLVEWRGSRDREEERGGDRAAGTLGLRRVEVRRVEPFPGARERHLHVFEKVAPTPAGFPRRAGVAARKPLGSS